MDTKFLEQALKNWQEKNHDPRKFDRLTPAQQSEIIRDAEDLKKKGPITIDEVLEGHARYISITEQITAEAKELQQFETMLRTRDAAIRAKYPITLISGSWRSL